MPIETQNSGAVPAIGIGAMFESEEPQSYYTPTGVGEGSTAQIEFPEQVVGLVPVFKCNDDDCRPGLFGGDLISDDKDYPLRVFAQEDPDEEPDRYYNDENSWLFNVPAAGDPNTFYEFYLDKLDANEEWQEVKHLDDFDNGVFHDVFSFCDRLPWKGYTMYWWKVLENFGTGMYRFRMTITVFDLSVDDPAYPPVPIQECMISPNFCLSVFDCHLANRSVKFETIYKGGRFGNIDKTNCGGKYWDFCCPTIPRPESPIFTQAITWTDSIRVDGFFGREARDYERNSIKYQTGVVNKIRDEAISKFKFRTFGNTASAPGKGYPQWLHDRLSVYGFQADVLYVSDYNLNNADYNTKRYCVIADGNYAPEHVGNSRYSVVEVDFKAQTQYQIRTRCC